MSAVITRQMLQSLLGERIGRGDQVVGPVQVKPGLHLYTQLNDASQLVLEGFIRPRNSIKDFIFPRHEQLFSYRYSGHGVEVNEVTAEEPPLVFIGARACDAGALPILDHVFNWDTAEESYNRRRETTVVLTLVCVEHDSECFCTTVGLGPAAESGSDALLFPLGDGALEVRAVTDKGRAFFADRTQDRVESAPTPAGPPVRAKLEEVQAFLKNRFEDPIWDAMSVRCLSCGACAFTCPTCHCFDIVDEGNAESGCRSRNWDSCQFCSFTAHASGHNPRSKQPVRQRQRAFHKFLMYPDRFGAFLCTGCGNCARNCPAGMGMLDTLQTVGAAAAGK